MRLITNHAVPGQSAIQLVVAILSMVIHQGYDVKGNRLFLE